MAKTPSAAAPTPKAAAASPAAPAGPLDPQQEALFREVEDDLRHERLVALWRRYGAWVIGAALLLVVGVAAGQGIQSWRAAQRAEAAQAYETALAAEEAGDAEAAIAGYAALAEEGPAGFAALAALNRAALLAQAGRTDEAVDAYRTLTADGDADPALRDTARVLAVLHGLALLNPAEVAGLLAPLQAEGGAWGPLADELAALQALRQDDPATARALLRGLADDAAAPDGARTRTRDLLSALGPAPADETPADPTPASPDASRPSPATGAEPAPEPTREPATAPDPAPNPATGQPTGDDTHG